MRQILGVIGLIISTLAWAAVSNAIGSSDLEEIYINGVHIRHFVQNNGFDGGSSHNIAGNYAEPQYIISSVNNTFNTFYFETKRIHNVLHIMFDTKINETAHIISQDMLNTANDLYPDHVACLVMRGKNPCKNIIPKVIYSNLNIPKNIQHTDFLVQYCQAPTIVDLNDKLLIHDIFICSAFPVRFKSANMPEAAVSLIEIRPNNYIYKSHGIAYESKTCLPIISCNFTDDIYSMKIHDSKIQIFLNPEVISKFLI